MDCCDAKFLQATGIVTVDGGMSTLTSMGRPAAISRARSPALVLAPAQLEPFAGAAEGCNATCQVPGTESVPAAPVSEAPVAGHAVASSAVGVVASLLVVALATVLAYCARLQRQLTAERQRLTSAKHELRMASNEAARLNDACRAGLEPDHEPLMKVSGRVGELGKDFAWVVHDERPSQRVIKVQCPGVSQRNVEVEIIFNGCVPTIRRPGSEGVQPATWSRCFQFHPSDGLFEFREDLAVLDQGILHLVFEPIRARSQGHAFRFPELFSLSDGDVGEMTVEAEEVAADCAAGRGSTPASATPISSPVHAQGETQGTPSAAAFATPGVGYTTPRAHLPNSVLCKQKMDAGHGHLRFGSPSPTRDTAGSSSYASCTGQLNTVRVAAGAWPPVRRQSM